MYLKENCKTMRKIKHFARILNAFFIICFLRADISATVFYLRLVDVLRIAQYACIMALHCL